MGIPSSSFIRPLGHAENQYLQVLLTQFVLTRAGRGVSLDIRFNEDTSAIWRRQGKLDLRAGIADFTTKAKHYQAELDNFLLRGEGETYSFNDPGFPFRYASGGTLPIIHFAGKGYYCFFYREIHPIGWNIANGGCDSREELLNPILTLERELREELIIIDPTRRCRYVFQSAHDAPTDQQEFVVARRLMREQFAHLDLESIEAREIPLKWLDGPDQLTVQIGEARPRTTTGCFLNINAEDFGIEIDRVAWINVDAEAVLGDGEMGENYLVNSPIGLFEVGRFNNELARDSREFVPDLFFYDLRRHTATELERIIQDEFMPRISKKLGEGEIREFHSAPHRLDLCPVTRRIVRRYISQLPTEMPEPEGAFEAFISFAEEDKDLAMIVYDYLKRTTGRRVFFSEKTLRDSVFSRAIDAALVSASCLIVVSSSLRNIMRGWVEYEWRSFHNDICNGRKAQDARVIPFVAGIDPRTLPLVLRYYQVLTFSPEDLGAKLDELRHKLVDMPRN